MSTAIQAFFRHLRKSKHQTYSLLIEFEVVVRFIVLVGVEGMRIR
jgi:hypothetical protein